MGMNNIQLYNLAKKYLGDGGSRFRKYCGLPSGAPWCCALVRYIFDKGDDSSLFYGGKNVVYVPNAETWLFANCANIPIYLAMPMDVLTFDWNNNGVPDHIGFVRGRKSDTEVLTIEGNTSGGIVANRVRPAKYISGCFRTQFAPSSSWSSTKKLEVDGQFGYSTIAVMQRWLGVKVDAVLGKQTVKALQRKFGVAQDGSWGTKTSKAIQRGIGVTADGWFGVNSVKAFQKYLNEHAFPTPKPVEKKTIWDNANAWARKIAADSRYHYVRFSDASYTQQCPICHPRNHHLGGNCIWYAWAIWHHGAGLPNHCSPEVINNQMADRLLKMTASEALAFVRKRTGLNDIAVYRTAEYFPVKNLKQGDILLLYDGKDYYHTVYYMGDGKMADSSSGRSDNIKADVVMSSDTKNDIKIAIRYTGKVVIS